MISAGLCQKQMIAAAYKCMKMESMEMHSIFPAKYLPILGIVALAKTLKSKTHLVIKSEGWSGRREWIKLFEREWGT